jgi:hypothetical protein
VNECGRSGSRPHDILCVDAAHVPDFAFLFNIFLFFTNAKLQSSTESIVSFLFFHLSFYSSFFSGTYNVSVVDTHSGSVVTQACKTVAEGGQLAVDVPAFIGDIAVVAMFASHTR